jgi:hypothetical protein
MRQVANVVEIRNVHRILMRKPEGKSPLMVPRHRWEANIKMNLEEMSPLMGCCFCSSRVTVTFSKWTLLYGDDCCNDYHSPGNCRTNERHIGLVLYEIHLR